jgi:hypothetical protein
MAAARFSETLAYIHNSPTRRCNNRKITVHIRTAVITSNPSFIRGFSLSVLWISSNCGHFAEAVTDWALCVICLTINSESVILPLVALCPSFYSYFCVNILGASKCVWDSGHYY